MQKDIADKTKTDMEAIGKVLQDAGLMQVESANTNLTASNNNLVASQTPLQVIVDLSGGGGGGIQSGV